MTMKKLFITTAICGLLALCAVQQYLIGSLNDENKELRTTLQVKRNYEYSLNNNYEKLVTEYESISQSR